MNEKDADKEFQVRFLNIIKKINNDWKIWKINLKQEL
jgi:hypothetical protein